MGTATIQGNELLPAQAVSACRTFAHQRVDGHSRVRFGKEGVSGLYQSAPCRLLFPRTADSAWPEAVSITTSGGLTGGDRVRFDIDVDAGAAGTVTTQAAEKLYRVLPGDADIRIETNIRIAAGGRAEWLAQEAIAFDRTRFRRRVTADLVGDARLLAAESLVLGRGAMGETFARGLVHDAWRIRRDGRLVWADALHLEGAGLADRQARFLCGSGEALATLLYAGPDAGSQLSVVRDTLPDGRGGATIVNGLLIARLLDEKPARMKADLMRAASALRAAAFDLPARMPAVWTC